MKLEKMNKQDNSLREEKPVVSLLLAVRNEENHIKACLNSIFEQDYPSHLLEVIIADGRSTDKTKEVIKKLIIHKKNYQLIDNPKIIQSSGWNLALENCNGEVISIVSGHITLPKDYVSELVDTLNRTNAEMVGGSVNIISHSKIGQAICIAMGSAFGVGNARYRLAKVEEETDTVFMGFCRRSVYEKIGGYDETLTKNQDDEFSYRLRKAGGRIICNPEVKSTYYSRSTYQSLWRQYFQYGFYKVRVLQKHPGQMRPRQFVPLLFVLGLILSLVLAAFFSWGWIGLVGLVGLYAFANLAVSLMLAKREGWRYFWLLPTAFATIHVSYGLGFLVGLFKFYDRW
jgi:glycosyltransferase involved in cell wall biosynthesis